MSGHFCWPRLRTWPTKTTIPGALVARGYQMEAKRLLREAAVIEPRAEIVLERLYHLGSP
jgi:hypothetical protein